MQLGAALNLPAWRGRLPVWLGLTAMVGLSWLYLARMQGAGGGGMVHSMAHPAMAANAAGLDALALAVAMWSVMMVAMMLPTAVPAISLFMTLTGRRHPQEASAPTTAMYIAGYAAAWTAYAIAAGLAQWVLVRAALLTPMGESTSASLSALVLLAAGAFQFTASKGACLTKCRSPLGFFLAEWRDGKAGAFVLGLRHGSYCVGCCWALMALMFVVGAMNLAWMAVLTVFLLGEKIAPAGWRLNAIAGVVLIAWSAWIAAALFR